ncbi:MAG: nuclear transport factor 2 family protein [Verrucomicrobiota bacterium]
MKKALIWVGCIAIAGYCGNAAASPERDTTADVIAREKAWSDAVIQHDTAKVASILADDFIGIDGRGFITDKAAELKEAELPPPGSIAPQLVKEELSDIKVRTYGDAAVLTAINTAHFSSKGKESEIKYRRTTVWVRESSGWRCVSFHGSRILESPKG